MSTWVALLRGVNVGGANKLAMPALRETFEQLGFGDVRTYIQSGNVVFEAAGREASIADAIRMGIADRHGLRVPVIVRSAAQMRTIVGKHPEADAGVEPKLLHVVFLDSKLAVDAVDADKYLPDSFRIDGREIYLAYPNGSARSKLSIEVFERAGKVTATARNLNTVRALVALL